MIEICALSWMPADPADHFHSAIYWLLTYNLGCDNAARVAVGFSVLSPL